MSAFQAFFFFFFFFTARKQHGDLSVECFPCYSRCQQAEVDFSRGAPEGHPEGAALSAASPLFTPADPACWAYGDTSWLFLVLCSRRACCWALPGLFHQPEAAWTETWSASKQSTRLFTANYFPESQALRTKWEEKKLLISLRLLNRLDGTWTLHLNKSRTPPHSIFLRPAHRLLVTPRLLFSLDRRTFEEPLRRLGGGQGLSLQPYSSPARPAPVIQLQLLQRLPFPPQAQYVI